MMLKNYRGRGFSHEEIARRREIVAEHMSRGIEDYNTICEAWIKNGLINPETNLPYDRATLSLDKNHVKQMWAKAINENAEMIVGKLVSKMEKVFISAYHSGDHASAIAATKAIREMLDLDKPKGSRALKNAADERLTMTGKGGMTEAAANEKAAELNAIHSLDNSPATFGEMLKIMRENGVIDAALLDETEGMKEVKVVLEKSREESKEKELLVEPSTNGKNGH